VSHIDLLRPPREWQPPYDLINPQSTKAANIRAAVEAVAAEAIVAPEVKPARKPRAPKAEAPAPAGAEKPKRKPAARKTAPEGETTAEES